MARVRSVSGVTTACLEVGWRFAETVAGAAQSPTELERLAPTFESAVVPGTAASSLRALGRFALGDAKDFDASDFWFRCPLGPSLSKLPSAERRLVLRMEGLATFAEVWLDGEHLVRSESMWEPLAIDLTGRVSSDSELFIRFASLSAELAKKRPRPRYKTRLVKRQELRHVRTTLLGRMPGWSPPTAPVGPFRPIVLEAGGPRVSASVTARLDGSEGIVTVRAEVGGRVERAVVVSGGDRADLRVDVASGVSTVEGELRIDDVEPWWPHTHGSQPRHEVELELVVDGEEVSVDLGEVGFRTIELDRGLDGRGFGLVINGEPVFVRGAVFTPLDVVSLQGTPEAYREVLVRVQRAGMNMVRLSGTLVYEADVFFDLCDELGILVWQDFMFANMDYPSDEAFLALAGREADAQLARVESSPSLAVVAGGSEVAQQAAMLGLGRDAWQPALFEGVLGRATERVRPDVAYVPSTPWGDPLPFRTDEGVTHYYGVGAYQRPLEDARRSSVRFAAECLAFANVPSRRGVDALLPGGEAPGHHPRWKERVPRDHGAGWDFEDVRDHYVGEMFRVDPAKVRYADPERWLALGRATTSELMAQVFSEWRRSASPCNGALVWLLRDLWPGAGFGLLEHSGHPKACYYGLARVLAPLALFAVDEGLNGVRFIAKNDRPAPLSADIEISLYLHSHLVKRATQARLVPARGEAVVDVDEALGGFVDPAHAYRFGPPTCDVVVAKLVLPDSEEPLATSFHFPLGHRDTIDPALMLEALGTRDGSSLVVTVRSNRLALFVELDVRGYEPDDDAFHLEPGGARTIRLRPSTTGASGTPSGTVRALNAAGEARIRFGES